MKDLSDQVFTPETHEWDSLALVIPETLREEMDRKLIIQDDLREAIWQAEETGERFISDDGVCQTSMVKSALTYWVQYKVITPGNYEVLDAWSHRMKFSRED